jgi:transglutaminase-like putative cysteine protease
VTLTTSARVRLTLRDLAAAAAFASMALSGAVPLRATIVFGLGALLALLSFRVLSRYSTFTAVLLGVGAVVLYANVAVGKLDLVVAACTFAGLTTVARVLAAPDEKTDGQVFLTSVLMIAGGAALSGDMLFAVAVTAFAVLTMVSVGMSVIERFAGAGESLPVRPALQQLLIGAGCALLGGALLFAFLPRFSWNLAARRAPVGGRSIAGFSDRVSLSGDGRIKTNPRIVARAKIQPDPATPSLQAYWWGRTFDTFTGIEWQSHGGRRSPRAEIGLPSVSGRHWHQSIELLPAYGAKTLFALQWPVSFSQAIAHTADGDHRVSLTELPGQEVRIDAAARTYSYQADSVEALEATETHPPQPNYLQLPANVDPRIAALARVAAGDAGDPVQAARNLERYLKSNYRYTLELPGAVGDPLAEFLFVRKAGHCEQFATALTVMLRTLGIPARLATGFFGGERIGDSYVIRAGDAHAWTQVVLPNARVISLDATPESSRPVQPAALLDWWLQAYETMGERWRSSVMDYSLQDQADLAQRLAAVKRPQSRTNAALGLAAVAAAILFWWGLLRRKRGAVHEATAMLASAERILARAGVTSHGSDCIEDIARRLATARHPLSQPMTSLTRRYLQARFGRQPLHPRESAYLIGRLAAAAQSVGGSHSRQLRDRGSAIKVVQTTEDDDGQLSSE